MRIKDIEGDPQDIQELFHKGECDLSSYIGAGKKYKAISRVWIAIFILLFFALACYIWTGPYNMFWNKISILSMFLMYFLILFFIQYNYGNKIFTVMCLIAGIVIILLALNVYSPGEIAKKLEALTVEQYEKSK